MPDKFNELLLKQDIIELYNAGITPDYGYLMNGRFEKDMIKTLYPLKTLSGNPISWEASDTEYLFPVVSLEPKQAGTGDPSPDNVRPISGYDSVTVTQSKDEAQVKQIALTLPETIYGGTVDAVSGEGTVAWNCIEFDGNENWRVSSNNIAASIDKPSNTNPGIGYCSHFNFNYFYAGDNIFVSNQYVFLGEALSSNYTVESWKQYLSQQFQAGTPVQVCYQLATPEPFQATGNQALTIQPGNHTIYTDGDTISLTIKARRLEV